MGGISGAGLPDYWSHNRSKAPLLARIAQDCHLMMTSSDHHKHHADPRIGYAYYSPLTNMVLETICFWDAAKWGMREVYGAEPLNIPVMKPRVGEKVE